MSIHIITDSASDIPQFENPRIHVVPMIIRFGETEWLDGVNLSHRMFYEKLIESDELPTTSQISPYAFSEVIRHTLEEEDCEEVLVITISSALSGTYQSACIAAGEFGDRVAVVDSLSVTVGQRALIDYALRLIDEGRELKDIAAKLEIKKKNINLIALLDTLEYLKKGGRISSATAFAGGILSLKPVVAVEDGKVVLVGTARGSKNTNNYLARQIEKSGGVDFSMPYYIGYTGLSDHLMQKYIRDSKGFWENETRCLPLMTIGGTIGTHVGPGAIGIAYFQKEG